MVKSAFDAPMSFDINANFLFFDRFEIGASYRLEDSFSGMVNFAFTDNIKLGYAYDRVMSDLNVVTNSSHEVFLQFDLNFPRKVSRSPRFF
jgi:superfamily I DNA and RNA helicase